MGAWCQEYFSGRDERRGQPLGVVTFTRDTLHDLRSVTKRCCSRARGNRHQLRRPSFARCATVGLLSGYTDLRVAERTRITIRHALSMSAGLEWNEDLPYTDPKNDEIVMDPEPGSGALCARTPDRGRPRHGVEIHGGTTQVLGAILQRATKQPLADYAREKLFSPLGITTFEWVGSNGVPSPASGLRLRPRDLAKFGSLYLHDGQWNGRQVLPREWVHESTRRRLTFPGQEARGYAYQWWHTCYATPSGVIDVPTAVGNGAQRIFLLFRARSGRS